MDFRNPLRKLYDVRQDANGNALPSWAAMGRMSKNKEALKAYHDYLANKQTLDAWNGIEDKAGAYQNMINQGVDIPEGVTDADSYTKYLTDATATNPADAFKIAEPDKIWTKETRGDTQAALKAWAGAHPMQIMGYGLGGTMNLAGLTDNDKFGGQILGAGLGAGLGAQGLGLFQNTGSVPLALAGGAIGSLFDKLRAKREQEAQYQNQYYR